MKLFEDILFIKCYKTGRLSMLKAMLSPSFICTFIYRLSAFFYCLKIPVLPKLLWWVNFLLFKVDLDFRSNLDGAIYMPHPMGVVIGEYVKLTKGSRLKLMQGATIGGDLGRFEKRNGKCYYQPIMQGNVFIGINSIVAGPVMLSGNIFVSSSGIVSRSAKDVLCYAVNKTKDLSDSHLKELRV